MATELKNNKDALKDRAKKEIISQKLALSPINESYQNGNQNRKQYYWNTSLPKQNISFRRLAM